LPLSARRIHLEDVMAGAGSYVLPARRLAANGLDAWAQVLGKGYEGYVAKDVASPYRGGVTRSWVKVKVPGWTDPEEKFKRMRLES
jgi:bifunctional non-homologous end joining protein LigD